MALFKRNKGGEPTANQDTHPVPGRVAFCRICGADRQFSNVWHRAERLRKCPSCEAVFNVDNDPYQKFQPACSRCAEPIESDGFEYGYCDGCGSKFELMDGGKPVLLPNKAQREAMNKFGKAWSKD